MYDYGWSPYVPVAERRAQAQREVDKLRKKGQPIDPVVVEGRTIARSFWGKSWCDNLERYSDYASRLPRGRTYVRNGSVIDLQIDPGQISAMVSGSRIYRVAITIAPIPEDRWKAVCADCAGAIDSLVELLAGKLSKSVMERVCRQQTGLFPSPGEIRLNCSCPDWASMCKHVAAVLYGVGTRLDHRPELLFALRQVDQTELLAGAGQGLEAASQAAASDKVLVSDDLSALFGLDLDVPQDSQAPIEATPAKAKVRPPRRARRPSPQEICQAARSGPRARQWNRIWKQIDKTHAKAYDEAVALIVALLAREQKAGRSAEALEVVKAIEFLYKSRPALMRRLRSALQG